jgi:hypothetical protein
MLWRKLAAAKSGPRQAFDRKRVHAQRGDELRVERERGLKALAGVGAMAEHPEHGVLQVVDGFKTSGRHRDAAGIDACVGAHAGLYAGSARGVSDKLAGWCT